MAKMIKKKKSLLVQIASVVLIIPLIIGSVADASYVFTPEISEQGKILEFESKNPVFDIVVYRNTQFSELKLPDSLRVIIEMTTDEKESFVQAQPLSNSEGDYDYYPYGYIAPADAEALYSRGEKVIYTINYADGTLAYRIFGHISEGKDQFFSCDEEGNLTGKVCEIEVAWNQNEYDSAKYDKKQRLIPTWADSLQYDGKVYAEVTVLGEEENLEVSGEHEESLNENITALNNENNISMSVFAATGASTPFDQAKAFMISNSPTSGNSAGTGTYDKGIPGTWKDYINTIWQNKGLNNFTFADSGVDEAWKWSGVNTATGSGAPEKNKINKPVRNGTTWNIYSVEQFIYAVTNYQNGDTLSIQRDLDFNGQNYNWSTLRWARNIIIDGNGHKFYNLLFFSTTVTTANFMRGAFLEFSGSSGRTITVKNLEFDSACCVCAYAHGGGLFGYATQNSSYAAKYSGCKTTLYDVTVKNSLFYNGNKTSGAGHISPLGAFVGYCVATSGNFAEQNTDKTPVERCTVEHCYVYGQDHVNGMLSRINNVLDISYSFVTDTLICGTGGHSAGIIGCALYGYFNAYRCFANVDMYGSKQIGGFAMSGGGTFTECFTTGKIEGFSNIFGFTEQAGGTFERCYTSALVGMRRQSTVIAGFGIGYNAMTMKDCYVAGEVGNYNTEIGINDSPNAGAFLYNYNSSNTTCENCYYDKQTTAMREWVTRSINTQKGQRMPGVTGVLTTTTNKNGNGLASGLSSDVSGKGFAGFTDNSKWVYTEGYYPQLYSMRWPNASWGDAERMALVKANSLASVSTVYLDTWDEGYDWNSKGVRSQNKVSYNRTEEEAFNQSMKKGYSSHVGDIYTYDTVREVVNDFTVGSARFTNMINGGRGANTSKKQINGSAVTTKEAINISNKRGTVKQPGMEWFKIEQSGTVTDIVLSAYRPIRLISFMTVEAGKDKTIPLNSTYDHTQDVELTIMNTIVDDLVVGIHDEKVWSTCVAQGYPSTKKYYEAVTDETEFSASKDAWVYTEIWQIKERDSILESPKSVRVTGEGTNLAARTHTEKQWIGELPIGTGLHEGMTFEITYYWMLSDGRYRSDSKLITLAPGTYSLTESVYNVDGTANSTALYLGTKVDSQNKDTLIQLADTRQFSTLGNQKRGSHVVASWAKNPDEDIDVSKLELSFKNGNLSASDLPYITNPSTGDKITITAQYYGYDEKTETQAPGGNYERITLVYAPVYVKLTYQIKEAILSDGTVMQYLIFDSQATIENNNWKLVNGEIQAPEILGYEKFNLGIKDIEFDIDVKLTIRYRYNFSLYKTDGNDNSSLEGVGFNLYQIQDTEGNIPKVTLDRLKSQGKPAQAYLDMDKNFPMGEDGAITGKDGRLTFYGLEAGIYYYLVEETPLNGYGSLKEMIRLYMDPDTGVVSMQRINSDGSQEGEPVKYALNAGDGINQMPEDFIITSTIKNYLSIDMPNTGGGDRALYFIFGLAWLTLALAILFFRKIMLKGGRQ